METTAETQLISALVSGVTDQLVLANTSVLCGSKLHPRV